MKKILLGLVIVFLMLFHFAIAKATSLSLQVQHRISANGAETERFALIPSPAGTPLDFTTFQLSLNNNPFNLTSNGGPPNINLLSYETINGSYNKSINNWTYDNSWGKFDYYYANVGSLPSGNYSVEIKTTGGQLLQAQKSLSDRGNLPVVDVNTFSKGFDSLGNFNLSWAIPQNIPANT